MKMHCPRCGVSGSADDSYLGRKVRCPKCREIFLVESPPEPAVEAEEYRLETHSEVAEHEPLDATEASPGEVDEEVAATAQVEQANLLAEDEALELGELVDTPEIPEIDADLEDLSEPFEQTLSPFVAEQAEPEESEPDSSTEKESLPPYTTFTVRELLKAAWDKTKGAMGSVWLGLITLSLVLVGVVVLLSLLAARLGVLPGTVAWIYANIAFTFIIGAVSSISSAGLMYMGVRRALGRSLTWKSAFSGYKVAGSVVIAAVLQGLLILAGFVLFIFPGIYLTVGYALTLPLIVDRKMPPWQAMETSRMAVSKVWWRAFGLFFLMGVINLIASIPLGIGLIWTVPLNVVVIGVLYRYLFGVPSEAKQPGGSNSEFFG